MNKIFFIFLLNITLTAEASPVGFLKSIEKKYHDAPGIEMNTIKKIKIELLDREKKSEGIIKIKPGGLFKWEIEKPEKSMVLLTPEAVWVVSYPLDDEDKLSVLKSRKPKKNQSPAVVAFLMGQGSLLKNFKILKTKKLENETYDFELQARSKDEMVQKLSLVINKKEMIIEKVSFVDSLGNKTEMEFKDINFKAEFESGEFIYNPPKDAEISILD